MKKLIKKMVELYARSSTNSCCFLIIHQPKAPKCLIQK
ncbi:MAG: cyclic lactone autoinducer peptide [Clostridia bacterium]